MRLHFQFSLRFLYFWCDFLPVLRPRAILIAFEKLTRHIFSKLYSKPYYYLYKLSAASGFCNACTNSGKFSVIFYSGWRATSVHVVFVSLRCPRCHLSCPRRNWKRQRLFCIGRPGYRRGDAIEMLGRSFAICILIGTKFDNF